MMFPISIFDALRAYAESRNIAVTGLKDIISMCRKVSEGFIDYRSLTGGERRVAELLWYLGLLTQCIRYDSGRPRLYIGPTSMTLSIAKGDVIPLVLRIGMWYPMRLLLKYMMWRGGYCTSRDVKRDLGGKVYEVTGELLDILRQIYGPRKFKEPVKKPFNRHVIESVFFRLGKELGVLRGDSRHEAQLTELGYELIRDEPVILIKTAPKIPLILLAVVSVLQESRQATLVSPWIDLEVVKILEPLLKNKEICVVARQPRKGSQKRALDILSSYGEVLIYPRLHTKLSLGFSALITSANLTKTSLLYNIETGIYYREVPLGLKVHVEEIKASARRY